MHMPMHRYAHCMCGCMYDPPATAAAAAASAQVPKAVLLEGSPGVGKTSLVAALAHQVRGGALGLSILIYSLT